MPRPSTRVTSSVSSNGKPTSPSEAASLAVSRSSWVNTFASGSGTARPSAWRNAASWSRSSPACSAMSRWLSETSPARKRSTGSRTSRSSSTAARSSSTPQPSSCRWSSSWGRASRPASSSSPSRSPSASQSMAGGTLQGGELVGEQVHQQAVAPVAARRPLVAPQHTHRLEADGGVGADGALVAHGGVDREAVVAAHLDQVADREAPRLGAEAQALVRGAEREGEGGMAVLGVGLLIELEQPGDLTADLDGEHRVLSPLMEQLRPHPRRVPVAPPLRDRRLGEDRRQRGDVSLLQRPEQHALAPQDGSVR